MKREAEQSLLVTVRKAALRQERLVEQLAVLGDPNRPALLDDEPALPRVARRDSEQHRTSQPAEYLLERDLARDLARHRDEGIGAGRRGSPALPAASCGLR